MKMQAPTVSTYLSQKTLSWQEHDNFLSPNLASYPLQSHELWSQTQSFASSHSLTLNTGLSSNLELDEAF